ncbi:MAG: Hsp70 family protein [Sedimentitalea sp.]
MPAFKPVLGVDFGTSNSAAGVLVDGKPQLIRVENDETTLPTAFFFDYDSRKTLIGRAATDALINGNNGRFMRALKRVLGTSLMHEKRQILNQRVTFVEIIAQFLAQIKARAEAETGLRFDRVLSGRPVHFHANDLERDARAEADLKACYLAAGFEEVAFLPEPEAAALASATDTNIGRGLIVDIGGGTSDFSLFECRAKGVEILANHGVRIGGTDFDRALSVAHVMPLLGKGTRLRKVMGEGLLLAPNAIFNDLATWEKIPFLYTGATRRKVSEMEKMAAEPERFARLSNVLEAELGHDIAFAVEAGKIAANSSAKPARVDLTIIEPTLSADLDTEALVETLSSYSQALQGGARDVLAMANVSPSQVDTVVYVGGSSLMSLVPDAMREVFHDAHHRFSGVFTAVADGLVLAADGHFPKV